MKLIYLPEEISGVKVVDIEKYMREQIATRPESLDAFNDGEVNMTLLAEDAAQEFELYDGDDIIEEVFMVSYNVCEEYNG